MVLSIEEAMKKYVEYLKVIDAFRRQLIAEDFVIDEEDAFELGALWRISHNQREIAIFEWNVPHMLAFEPLVSQQEEQFNLDYVKNASDWSRFINDVAKSVTSVKQSA